MLARRFASLGALVPFLVALAPLAACGGKVLSEYETPSPSSPATPVTTPGTTPGDPGVTVITLPDGGKVGTLVDGGTVTTTPPTTSTSCSAPALTCSDTFPGAVPYSSSTASELVGVWIDCPTAQSVQFPSADVGEEFAADGTHYYTILNSKGEYVRDEDPATMGTWKVGLQGGAGPGLLSVIISNNEGTLYGEYGLSTCPRALVSDSDLELPAP